MPIVQCRVFSRSLHTLTPDSIASGLAQLQDEINIFVATLPFDSVLDIQFKEVAIPKGASNTWLLCRAWVTYLE